MAYICEMCKAKFNQPDKINVNGETIDVCPWCGRENIYVIVADLTPKFSEVIEKIKAYDSIAAKTILREIKRGNIDDFTDGYIFGMVTVLRHKGVLNGDEERLIYDQYEKGGKS